MLRNREMFCFSYNIVGIRVFCVARQTPLQFLQWKVISGDCTLSNFRERSLAFYSDEGQWVPREGGGNMEDLKII